MLAKLYSGGGEDVDHSSVHASQGSLPASCAIEHGVEEVANENENGHRLEEDANGDDEIPDVPASAGLVGVDAAGHAKNAGDVHEIEGEMESR